MRRLTIVSLMFIAIISVPEKSRAIDLINQPFKTVVD